MEVKASGDLGYFWSTYTLTATPKAGGNPIKSAGKSVFIVKRQPGGAWKIMRLIDNSDGTPSQLRAHANLIRPLQVEISLHHGWAAISKSICGRRQRR